jgi:hypothetical protein
MRAYPRHEQRRVSYLGIDVGVSHVQDNLYSPKTTSNTFVSHAMK